MIKMVDMLLSRMVSKYHSKFCSKCQQLKTIYDFHHDVTNKKDGLYGSCKDCKNKKNVTVELTDLTVSDVVKICSDCKESKSVSLFHKRGKLGVQAVCKECRRGHKHKLARLKYDSSPKGKASSFKSLLLHKYGMTLDQFNEMLKAQEFKCKICKTTDPGRVKINRMSVDHDHETGQVRALTCHHCNTGLGAFQDSPTLLEEAAAYLRSHGKK